MSAKVLVDTNVFTAVLASGNARSASARVVENVLQAHWRGVFSTATFLEVTDVLLRPEFGIPRDEVIEFLDALANVVEWQHPQPSPVLLRDEGDQKWLNLLHASKADALITHNLRDFAKARTAGYPVMKPVEAIKTLS